MTATRLYLSPPERRKLEKWRSQPCNAGTGCRPDDEASGSRAQGDAAGSRQIGHAPGRLRQAAWAARALESRLS